uniref:Uncharacterized protein n=1 Tax=Sphaerodactylus townsendi TaxID=933632 RepID=A0ACB8E8P0_9SAUR
MERLTDSGALEAARFATSRGRAGSKKPGVARQISRGEVLIPPCLQGRLRIRTDQRHKLAATKRRPNWPAAGRRTTQRHDQAAAGEITPACCPQRPGEDQRLSLANPPRENRRLHLTSKAERQATHAANGKGYAALLLAEPRRKMESRPAGLATTRKAPATITSEGGQKPAKQARRGAKDRPPYCRRSPRRRQIQRLSAWSALARPSHRQPLAEEKNKPAATRRQPGQRSPAHLLLAEAGWRRPAKQRSAELGKIPSIPCRETKIRPAAPAWPARAPLNSEGGQGASEKRERQRARIASLLLARGPDEGPARPGPWSKDRIPLPAVSGGFGLADHRQRSLHLTSGRANRPTYATREAVRQRITPCWRLSLARETTS